MDGYGRWRRAQAGGEGATDEPLEQERWPIRVVCRDVNYFHQCETRRMHNEDIAPFLEDELCGPEWSRQHLEAVLDEIHASGCGFLDPAVLVPTDSWLNNCEQYDP